MYLEYLYGEVSELVDEHDLGSCCFPGGVPELVDGPDLGSGAAMRRGSSPRFPTLQANHRIQGGNIIHLTYTILRQVETRIWILAG